MIAGLFWASVALIVYVYAGYPLLLAAIGPLIRWRPVGRRGTVDRTPLGPPRAVVSCIVPALDEEATIASKIENLIGELDGRPFEIIVVDDGSTDRTVERARAIADDRVVVISHPRRRGKPTAINTGVAASRGTVLVLSDADVLVEPGSIEAMLGTLAEPGVGIVGAGRVLAGAADALAGAESLYWRYEQYLQERESALGACVAMSGAVLVLDRASFEPLPADVINDDFYLAMQTLRRGHRAVHEPAAIAVVGVAADAAAERRRRARIVAGRWQAIGRARRYLPWRRPLALWEVCSHKLLRPVVPLAFLIALAAAAVAAVRPGRGKGRLIALRGPWRAGPLVTQLLFLAAAAIGIRLDGRSRIRRVLYVPTYLVSSNRAAIAGLVGYLTGRQGARWKRAPSPHVTIPFDRGLGAPPIEHPPGDAA